MNAPSRIATAAVILAAVLGGGAARADEPEKSEPSRKTYAVKAYRDLTYWDIRRDPDRDRHQLDVYRPKEQTKCPVLFFVHGGAWTIGSKDEVLGIYGYGTIGRCLAERGLVVVMPNYRLSPGVKHPEHIKDVARAFEWTCKHVADYGGDPERIYVAGHSSGGHLIALLATDPTYLKAVGRSDKDIRGVIGVSGVYCIEDLDLKHLIPARCKCPFRDKVNPVATVFGSDPDGWKDASPIHHVRPGLPPFLLLSAGWDYYSLRRMTRDFAAALKDNGCDVRTETINWRTHETMVFDIAHLTAEPKLIDAVVGFIERDKPPPTNELAHERTVGVFP
jgi:acetyl esterase/lipase